MIHPMKITQHKKWTDSIVIDSCQDVGLLIIHADHNGNTELWKHVKKAIKESLKTFQGHAD